MIVFLLLVIIAIMLFGSSAVLGMIGAIAGFVMLVFALFFGAYLLATAIGVTPHDLFQYGLPGLLIFVLVGRMALGIFRELSKARSEGRDRKESSRQKAAQAARQAIFRAPAPNKAEKKAKRRKAGF